MSKLPQIPVGIEMERSVSQFFPTRKFGITSRGGQLISVRIFQPKFAILFLTNWLFVLIRNLEEDWLARCNWKMFHFPWVFPLISDRLVWHNAKCTLSTSVKLPTKSLVCLLVWRDIGDYTAD